MAAHIKNRYLILLIIIVGFVVYGNSLFNGFVWDDELQIVRNVTAHNISNFFQFFQGSTSNSGGAEQLAGRYYRPLLTTFLSLIYTFFGPNPFFFHFFQVVLHITNSILVYLILGYFLSKPIAMGASLLFLVHPINTESVAYISASQETLFFFFGALALWMHIKGKSLLIIFSLILFSMLSKETGILFLPVLFLYEALFKKIDKKFFVLGCLTSLSYLFLRFVVGDISSSLQGPFFELSLAERIVNTPKIVLFYIKTFLFPYDLAINQYWIINKVNAQNFFLPLIFDILFFFSLFLLGYLFFKNYRELFAKYLFFTFWLILGLGLHSQIVPLDMTVADRWFYFPILGLLGIFGCGLSLLKLNSKRLKNVLIGTFAIIFVLLSIRTTIRNTNWKDNFTLYSHDIKINKDSYQLESNFGIVLAGTGKFDEAEIHYRKSIELYPRNPVPYSNLGNLYSRKEDYETAYQFYKKALSVGNDYFIYEKFAAVTLTLKGPLEAKEFTLSALKEFPNNPVLWIILAVSHHKLGEEEEAYKALDRYKSLPPDPQYKELYDEILRNTFGQDF